VAPTVSGAVLVAPTVSGAVLVAPIAVVSSSLAGPHGGEFGAMRSLLLPDIRCKNQSCSHQGIENKARQGQGGLISLSTST
jgi:hypothetical protein